MNSEKPQDTGQCGNDGAVMAAPVKTIVYASLDGSTVKFSLFPDDDQAADKFDGNKIRLGPGSGAHDIHFRLVDGTRRGLKFSDDPIWSQDNVDCPSGKGNSSQFSSVAMKGKVLVVTDKNDNPTTLKIGYQLNFVDKGGNALPYDPIIINDGGQIFR